MSVAILLSKICPQVHHLAEIHQPVWILLLHLHQSRIPQEKRKSDCSCLDLETASKRVENTGASLDKDFTPELVYPPPVSIEDDDPNDLESNITDEEDDNIPSLKPKKHAIIYSDEESEEDNHNEAEESDESLEEAAANTSEAHTDNAETNSQPERVKIQSVCSSSIMKEEVEFWSSYLGNIKSSHRSI